MVRNLYELPNPTWPPGFSSLRKVALYREYLTADEVAPVFLLPAIESIYINNLDWDSAPQYNLPAASSSVQHLMIDSCLVSEEAYNLIDSANNLRSLVLKDCDLGLSITHLHQELSIERLIFCESNAYSYGIGDFDKITYELYKLADTNIHPRVLTLDLNGIISGADPNISKPEPRWRDEQEKYFVPKFTSTCTSYLLDKVPTSVETVIVDTSEPHMIDQDLETLDITFARLIAERRCPKLGHLYLDCVNAKACLTLPKTQSDNIPERPEYFHITVAAGKKCGVEVFTQSKERPTSRFLNEMCNDLFDLSLVSTNGQAFFDIGR